MMDKLTFNWVKGRLLSNYNPGYSQTLPSVNEGTRHIYSVSKKEFTRLTDLAIGNDDVNLAAFLAKAYAYSPIGPNDSYSDFKRLLDRFYNRDREYRDAEAYSQIKRALLHIVREHNVSKVVVDTPKRQSPLDLAKRILETNGRPSPLRPMPLVEDLN